MNHPELNYTTFTKNYAKPLTLDDLQMAIEMLPEMPPHFEKMEVNKKTYAALKKRIPTKQFGNNILAGALGGILGPRIIVKPYIKKVKLYRKLNDEKPTERQPE